MTLVINKENNKYNFDFLCSMLHKFGYLLIFAPEYMTKNQFQVKCRIKSAIKINSKTRKRMFHVISYFLSADKERLKELIGNEQCLRSYMTLFINKENS
jgi:hypothetical protein